MRSKIEDLIEFLLETLDRLDSDPDLEESLGWSADGSNADAYVSQHPEFCDLEGDEHDGSEPEVDEPSLGWTAALMQIGSSWAGQAAKHFDFDREWDDAEHGIADHGGLAEQMGLAI
ncbi:hypothetical protein [Rhizobium binxianense]